MNIKRFFRDQREGFKSILKEISYDSVIFTTFIVSWVALLLIMVTFNGLLLGFVKTVLISTVVCVLSYNIAQFFKKND